MNSGPLLKCFMINYHTDKDLNISFSFPNEVTPLALRTDFRTIIGPKPEKTLGRLRLGKMLDLKNVCN